jgi:hypothetical protein
MYLPLLQLYHPDVIPQCLTDLKGAGMTGANKVEMQLDQLLDQLPFPQR